MDDLLTKLSVLGVGYTTHVARTEGKVIDDARTRWQQQKKRADSAMSEAGAQRLKEHE
jgi:hypothetical protein